MNIIILNGIRGEVPRICGKQNWGSEHSMDVIIL